VNTGQSLLAIGAMILLSILILRVNNTFLTTSSTFMDTKFEILATSLATSQMQQIDKLKFDQNSDTTGNYFTNTSELTSPFSLGPETGETGPSTFNDIDDYNGYTTTINGDSALPSANFNIRCTVNYVTDTNPNVVSSSATWNKRITVYVTSVSMPDTVKLSTIFSYWNFN
jgi:MSHA pilin protein MshD